MRILLTDHPRPPFPKQHQDLPSSSRDRDPCTDHGEDSWHGQGWLEGKREIIACGESGISRTAAIAFAWEGADAALFSLKETGDASSSAGLFEEAGPRCLRIYAHLSHSEKYHAVIDRVMSEFWRFEVLISHAGISRSPSSPPL